MSAKNFINPCEAILAVHWLDNVMGEHRLADRWAQCELTINHKGTHRTDDLEWTDDHDDADVLVAVGQSYDPMPCH